MIDHPIRTLADIEAIEVVRYGAMERTFPQLLSPWLPQAPAWQVTVGPDPVHGVGLKIELAAALPLRREITQSVNEVMAGFSLNNQIAWRD